jgi:hypothetical protein
MNRKINRALAIVFLSLFLISNSFGLPQGAERAWGELEPGNLGDVNLFNGTLNMRIPIFNITGRDNNQIPIVLNLNKDWRKYYYAWAQAPGTAERYTTNCAVVYLDGVPNGTQCNFEGSAPPFPNLVQFYKKIMPTVQNPVNNGYVPGLLYGIRTLLGNLDKIQVQPVTKLLLTRSFHAEIIL